MKYLAAMVLILVLWVLALVLCILWWTTVLGLVSDGMKMSMLDGERLPWAMAWATEMTEKLWPA